MAWHGMASHLRANASKERKKKKNKEATYFVGPSWDTDAVHTSMGAGLLRDGLHPWVEARITHPVGDDDWVLVGSNWMRILTWFPGILDLVGFGVRFELCGSASRIGSRTINKRSQLGRQRRRRQGEGQDKCGRKHHALL